MERVVDPIQDPATRGVEPFLPELMLADCYQDMRRIARAIMAGDSMRLKLQPTDLVNEAALRLIQSMPAGIADRGHMLALAARTMRRVLIDEVRRHRAAKRVAPQVLTQFPGGAAEEVVDVEDLDRALVALGSFSAEHARVVELRFTLGMSVEETAQATGMAERTVKRRWQAARAWLLDYLAPDLAPAGR